MNIKNIHSIYFIGIGGIGMSAIARYFNYNGVKVAGYDRSSTPLTDALEAEGMDVRFEENIDRLPKEVDLVVYTPAIPDTHQELQWFKDNNYPLYKRSQVLGIISKDLKTVAVAGTHGKTTTSTLTTHLLKEGGVDCNAFLGGVANNFSSNFVSGTSDWVVVEADEYDRSFLTLFPDLAVVMSMDADHLDIYGTAEQLLETGFKAFAKKMKAGGKMWVKAGLEAAYKGIVDVATFGIEEGDCQARNLRVEDGFFVFDYKNPSNEIKALRHPHPGRHNVENALGAITIALELGASHEQIRNGLLTFKGINRRFEFVIRTPKIVYIDDYAHHPTELEAAIGAARELYPNKKITGIFQPHLFSRTRDFVEGFAKALDHLDEIFLLDIYPAREAPIEGVSSAIIDDLMKNPNRTMLRKEDVLEKLSTTSIDVLMTLGAGDIATLVKPIQSYLQNRNNG